VNSLLDAIAANANHVCVSFDLKNDVLKNLDLPTLFSLKHLSKVVLHRCRLTDDDVESISKLLANTNACESLSLVDNPYGSRGVAAMASTLHTHSTLTTIARIHCLMLCWTRMRLAHCLILLAHCVN